MLRLYNTALLPLRVAVELWARRPFRSPAQRIEWAERRALKLAHPPPGGLWIHGASVGEARLVRDLARAIRAARPALPLAVSAVTPAGRRLLPEPPEVDCAFFAPLDFPGMPRRLLGAVRPAVLALVETELWPNLLAEALAGRAKVVVVNGRLSPRRMARYRRYARLYRPLLGGLARLGAQTGEDAERFVELGTPPQAVSVTGNLKYDLAPPRLAASELRERFGLDPGRPVLVAGSTGRGEEEHVFEALAQTRREFGDVLLVLAPRHLERLEQVERLARARGDRVGFLSRDSAHSAQLDTLLVDTVGDLPALYQLASVAFVGGSMIPLGGHNVLEPAAVGVPVLFGPHTDSMREPAAALEQAGAGLRVRDAQGLSRSLGSLLGDPERRTQMGQRGMDLVRTRRGALERSVRMLLEVFDA